MKGTNADPNVKIELGSNLALRMRRLKKKILLAVRSDKILCSQCVQRTVRVLTYMRCAQCEPGFKI